MNLVLFGFQGCGKSHFGRLLAGKLKLPFTDSDRLIEHLYAEENEEKLSCRAIYRKHGERYFRLLEKRAIAALESISILAVGGGSVLDPGNVEILQHLGQMVYLKADKERLKERVDDLPAFLEGEDFDAVYNARSIIYEAIPAIRLDAHDPEILIQLEEIWRATHLAQSSK